MNREERIQATMQLPQWLRIQDPDQRHRAAEAWVDNMLQAEAQQESLEIP